MTEILNIASQVSVSMNYVQIPQVVNTFAACVGFEKAVTKKTKTITATGNFKTHFLNVNSV